MSDDVPLMDTIALHFLDLIRGLNDQFLSVSMLCMATLFVSLLCRGDALPASQDALPMIWIIQPNPIGDSIRKLR